jgi:uncharacterized protein YheU (UPF0270 family)
MGNRFNYLGGGYYDHEKNGSNLNGSNGSKAKSGKATKAGKNSKSSSALEQDDYSSNSRTYIVTPIKIYPYDEEIEKRFDSIVEDIRLRVLCETYDCGPNDRIALIVRSYETGEEVEMTVCDFDPRSGALWFRLRQGKDYGERKISLDEIVDYIINREGKTYGWNVTVICEEW